MEKRWRRDGEERGERMSIYKEEELDRMSQGVGEIARRYDVAIPDVHYALYIIAKDVVGEKLKRDLKEIGE